MEFKYEGNSAKSGVYRITNKINGKIYIGSAKFFRQRARQHHSSLKNNKHQNKHLQASFNKHGSDAFLFEILEVVEGDKIQRTTIEQKYLDEQIQLGNWETSCYNATKKSIQKQGPWSNNPKATKRKLKKTGKKWWASLTEEEKMAHSQRASANLIGHVVTDETREKLRLANLGKVCSKIGREKRSKTMKNTLSKRKDWYFNTIENKERLKTLRMGKEPWNKGHKMTEKEIENLKQQHKIYCAGNPVWIEKQRKAHLGKKDSNETIERKRQSSKTKKPIWAINLITKEEILFPSLKNAAETLKIFDAIIYQILKGKQTKTKGCWTFKRI